MIQPQRWDELGDLFSQLLAMAPEQRASFMQSACGDDHELRAELVSLLSAHDAQGPLDAAPEILAPDAEPPEPAELPGSQVGPYRLLRRLGEGGMGSVWLAERSDGSVKRSIALKRPHVRWVGGFAERALQERDILAGLEHPNIARLYDAGVTETGEPYLALEFIDGVPLTQFCDARGLSVDERLELLLQVLEAVQYAHSRLVIHGDIKPLNILVSAQGRVHLLDFGIAKLLNRDVGESPLESAAPFTPDYASIEQVDGAPIGTASDIYSLGVVSYEILTGARPYRLRQRSAAALAIELEKTVVQPASASVASPSLKRKLKGDLDAILNKALQRDPARRYATVDAFAGDIRRHLASQPVLARPDRVAYRLGRFIARNRWQAASIAVAVAALVTGAAMAFWQAHEARLEAARAEQVKSFALSMLESADTDSGSGANTTAVELLQTARLRVENELAGRPGIAAELMGAIGYGLLGQDRPEDAAAVLKKAIALSTQANGPDDIQTVSARIMYGEALYSLGESKEAIALLRPAAQRAHLLHDAHWEVDALRWLSSALIDTGDVKAGVASARAAVAALPNPLPAGRRAYQDAIQAHLGLANALSSVGLAGVADEARAALAVMAEIEGWRNTSHWWAAHAFLGRGLVKEGQVAAGLRELQAAYEGSKALLGPDHEETEIYASYWGGALLDAGEVQLATAAYQIALDAVLRRESGRGSSAVAYEHYGLGSALGAAGESKLALSHFDAAAQLFAAAGGADSPLVARTRSARAVTLVRLGRLDEADAEMVALAKASLSEEEKAQFKTRLALLRSRQLRHDEAVVLAQTAGAELPALSSKSRQAQALSIIGRVMLAANRPQEAATALERSVALFREAQVKVSPDRLEAEAALADAQRATVSNR
ncbi:MAG: serine/threonine-protein kinase [Gammaproteobacteria bacterium]